MKGSSLATVVLIATITTVATALILNAILGNPNDRTEEVVYLNTLNTEVIQPDPEVFNTRAVNPTVEVYVGGCEEDEVWVEEQQACVEVEDPEPEEE